MEEITEDDSGSLKYLTGLVDRSMMVEWRDCRPAHVLKTCAVQPLSVIVDEIYLPLLAHEVLKILPSSFERYTLYIFPTPHRRRTRSGDIRDQSVVFGEAVS